MVIVNYPPDDQRGKKDAAGPFSATAALMATACTATEVQYRDITEEIDVFKALAEELQ